MVYTEEVEKWKLPKPLTALNYARYIQDKHEPIFQTSPPGEVDFMIENSESDRKIIGIEPVLLLFCIAVAVAMFGEAMYVVYIPNFLSESEISLGDIGIFYTVFFVINALVSIPAGYISDRVGRNILIFSLFVLGAVVFFYPLAETRAHLLLLRACHAIAHAFFFPVSRAYVMDKSTEENRGRAMGLYGVSLTVAGTVAVLIGGVIREITGSFDLLFYTAAIFPVASAIFLIVVVRDLGRGFTVEKMAFPTRDLIRNKAFVVLLLMFALVFSVSGVMNIVVPLFAIEELGMSYTFLGALSMCVGIILVFSQYAVGVLSDKYGRKRLLVYPFIIFAVGTFFAAASANQWMFLSAYLLIGVGTAPLSTVAYSSVGDVVKQEQRGTASGAANSASNVGEIFGPLIGSALGAALGLRAPLFVCSGLVAAAVVLLVLMFPSTKASE